LLASGEIKPEERVVLFNTGAGLKYTDTVVDAMHLRKPGSLPTSMPVGGIITPV
jgi:threonine synthase